MKFQNTGANLYEFEAIPSFHLSSFLCQTSHFSIHSF